MKAIRIPIPREHGTWAMLYAPMLLAIVVTGPLNLRSVLFLLATTALFFLRNPLESSIRLRILNIHDPLRLKNFELWASIYAITALVPGVILIFHYRLFGLLWFVLLLVITFVTHIVLAFNKKERGIFSEIMAVVALTSSAAAMQYTLSGSLQATGWSLWVLSILYFSSSVFYVKMYISQQRQKEDARSITITCFVYHAFLVVILTALALYDSIPVLTVFAFVPVVIRIFSGVRPKNKLNIKRIGLAEVFYTLFFVSWIAIFARHSFF